MTRRRVCMTSPLLAPEVLRRMVHERIAAAQRGDISTAELRGYLTAMFHAGAISLDECRQFLAGEAAPFTLTPPDTPTS